MILLGMCADLAGQGAEQVEVAVSMESANPTHPFVDRVIRSWQVFRQDLSYMVQVSEARFEKGDDAYKLLEPVLASTAATAESALYSADFVRKAFDAVPKSKLTVGSLIVRADGTGFAQQPIKPVKPGVVFGTVTKDESFYLSYVHDQGIVYVEARPRVYCWDPTELVEPLPVMWAVEKYMRRDAKWKVTKKNAAEDVVVGRRGSETHSLLVSGREAPLIKASALHDSGRGMSSVVFLSYGPAVSPKGAVWLKSALRLTKRGDSAAKLVKMDVKDVQVTSGSANKVQLRIANGVNVIDLRRGGAKHLGRNPRKWPVTLRELLVVESRKEKKK